MAKFTKGPWKWKWESALSCHILSGADGERIHTDGSACGEYSADIDVNGPDARLIAAAPEMYEAMAEFVHRVDIGEVLSKKTYAKFKAILAKADGTENGE